MPDDTDRYRANFTDEINSAYLYRIAAELEPDSTISGVYLRLAETEERHAALWEESPVYDDQPEATGTSLSADERSHAVMLDASEGGQREASVAAFWPAWRVVIGQ